jgi:hypothetical protein
MDQGLTMEQLVFLQGPVAARAKTIPEGTNDDKELIALLRQALSKTPREQEQARA